MGLRQFSGSCSVRMASSTMVHKLPASAPCPRTGTSRPSSCPSVSASLRSKKAACTNDMDACPSRTEQMDDSTNFDVKRSMLHQHTLLTRNRDARTNISQETALALPVYDSS